MVKEFPKLVYSRVLSDTIRNKPKYFIIDYHFADIIGIPLAKYLKDHYRIEKTVAGCQVLRSIE